MFERKNPFVNTNSTPLSIETKYDTSSDEFMMAFFAENYQTGEPVSDPNYVNWVTRLVVTKSGVKTKTWYPMHQCSDEDFAKFYDPKTAEAASKVNRIQGGGHLFCHDWKAL